MSSDAQTITVGQNAPEQMLAFCQALPGAHFTIVADPNTYAALGERIETALKGAGLPVTSIILTGAEIIADEKYLMQTLIQAPPGDQVFVAIGSGTITDIARYVSFRTRNSFISMPTAASVDGFVSTVAPLVVNGVKETYPAQGPIAVFADIRTLGTAPHRLTAAGFGDVLGKTTSLADWRLGQLLWNEPYDPAIERRVRRTLANCCEAVDDIGAGTELGVHYLIDALIDSGLCMLAVGNSRPASGSEHHCSHYWEMQLLQAHQPAILHGAKVGYAASLVAQLYDKIRHLSQSEVKKLVGAAQFAGPEAATAEIRQVYGSAADQILRIQQPFLALTAEEYRRLQQRVVDNWSAIQEIATTVLPANTILNLLERAGGPTTWQELGLAEAMVMPGMLYGHYLRNRFTVVKLCTLLGLDIHPSL